MKGILVILMLLSFPLFAVAGEVYQWVDDQGVAHFTDNPDAVPEDYRGAAEIREMDEAPVTESPRESQGQQGEEILAEEEEFFAEEEGILVEDDLKEKDEEWWRERAEKWRKRVQSAYDNYERIRLRYNEMATEFNNSKDAKKRDELKVELDKMQIEMKELTAEVDQAKKMRDKVLPSQAKKAGKPLEWVR
jgi:hypothetical protein